MTVLTVTQSIVMQVEQTLAVEMMMGHSETGVGLSLVGRRGLVSGVVMMLLLLLLPLAVAVTVDVGRD